MKYKNNKSLFQIPFNTLFQEIAIASSYSLFKNVTVIDVMPICIQMNERGFTQPIAQPLLPFLFIFFSTAQGETRAVSMAKNGDNWDEFVLVSDRGSN